MEGGWVGGWTRPDAKAARNTWTRRRCQYKLCLTLPSHSPSFPLHSTVDVPAVSRSSPPHSGHTSKTSNTPHPFQCRRSTLPGPRRQSCRNASWTIQPHTAHFLSPRQPSLSGKTRRSPRVVAACPMPSGRGPSAGSVDGSELGVLR